MNEETLQRINELIYFLLKLITLGVVYKELKKKPHRLVTFKYGERAYTNPAKYFITGIFALTFLRCVFVYFSIFVYSFFFFFNKQN